MLTLERRPFIKWLISERTHCSPRFPERQGCLLQFRRGGGLTWERGSGKGKRTRGLPLGVRHGRRRWAGGVPTLMSPQGRALLGMTSSLLRGGHVLPTPTGPRVLLKPSISEQPGQAPHTTRWRQVVGPSLPRDLEAPLCLDGHMDASGAGSPAQVERRRFLCRGACTWYELSTFWLVVISPLVFSQ